MRRFGAIWSFLLLAVLTACNSYFRESQKMEAALEQAKAVYGDGNLKWTRVGNNEATKISMEYDHAGNRTRLHDPDYCTAQKDLVFSA